MSFSDDAENASSTEREEVRRLRVEVARLQLERDAAYTTGHRPTEPRQKHRRDRIRRIVAVLLVFLTAALACAAVPAMYLRSEILNTDRYIATVAPLASDPVIQAEVADKVTAQIAEAVDLEGITRDAMIELGKTAPRVAAVITALAPAIAEQTKSFVHSAASKFVASPEFQDLWIRVNRVAHQGIVNLASGDTGTVSVDQSGTVSISTREIIARVKTLLLNQGVDIAGRIPEVDAQITLLQSPELVRATEAIRMLDRTAPLLAWLTALSALSAIAVAPRGWRRRTTSNVGLGVAVAMAVLALAVAMGLDIFLRSIPSTTVSPASAQTLADALLAPLRTGLRFVFVVALLVALAAFLGGHSRSAVYVRRGFARTGEFLTGKAGAGHAGQWRRRLARYRRILQGTVVGVAVLVLIFWDYPTAAVSGWTAVIAGLAILLIELLCRPVVSPADALKSVPASAPNDTDPTLPLS